MTKSKLILRRFIAFAGAVIITVNIAAAPQRARAVAVTASVIASVAAIMTACGVGYWAATQQDAIEYLGGKIDDYFSSLETVPVSYEDWLGINAPSQLFEVVSDGAMQFGSGVANKILDFVRWFNAEEGVVSGGEPVGILGGVTVVGTYRQSSDVEGSVSAQSVGNGIIRLTFDGALYKGGKVGEDLCILLSGDFDGRVTVHTYPTGVLRTMVVGFLAPDATSLSGRAIFANHNTAGGDGATNSVPSSADDLFAIGIQTPGMYGNPYSGTIDFEFTAGATDVVKEREVQVTPSSAVSVPTSLSDNDVLMVTPSVALTEGMTVEDASAEIYDGVTSEDGLTSEGETAGGAAAGWGWLADLLERIRQAVEGTQEAVENNHEAVQGMQEAVEGTQQAVEGTQQAVEGTQEAVEGMQEAVEGIEHAVQPAQYSAIQSYQLNLTNFFPFCIPWDLFRGLSLLVADPVAPSISWTVPLPGGGTYTLALDLSEWDGVASVARTMELLAFVVALAVATKKLIKW